MSVDEQQEPQETPEELETTDEPAEEGEKYTGGPIPRTSQPEND